MLEKDREANRDYESRRRGDRSQSSGRKPPAKKARVNAMADDNDDEDYEDRAAGKGEEKSTPAENY